MRTIRVASEPLPVDGLLHLLVLYLVWGSTYLGIRVAVRGGDGFAPFVLGATRLAAAGTILIAWSALRRERVRPTRREAGFLLLTGTLLWLAGNGLVNWAETRVVSGYAALIIGTTPILVASMESIIDRRAPSWRFIGSIIVGFSGLVVLTLPVIRAGGRGDAVAVAALIMASLSWGAGLILFRRRPLGLSPRVASGYQQLAGAVGFTLTALVLHERRPPSFDARAEWIAWGWLVTFGSVIAFTSFLQALKALPTRIVTSYAYVNPVVAVFLGWLILHEPVTRWTVAGTALIIAGVAGVFANR